MPTAPDNIYTLDAEVIPELTAGSTSATFNASFKGFDCGTSCGTLPLQKGRSALRPL